MRPLGAGEILDVAIKIYRRNWATLFRVVAVVVAPVQLVTMVVLASAVPEPELLTDPLTPPADPGQPLDASDVWALVGGTVSVLVLTFLATTLATAACFKAITDSYLGEAPGWRESLRFAIRRLPSVLLVTILSWVLILLGLVACIVPGVWLYVSWSVALPALLAEDVRGRRALGRSYDLVRGRWWPVFGILVLTGIFTAIVSNVVTFLLSAVTFTPAGENLLVALTVSAVSGTIAAVVTTPLTAAVVAVIYFDQRVRKEGFDLELLAARVGIAPGGEAGDRPALGYAPPPPPAGQPPFWPPPPGWQPPAGRGAPPADTQPGSGDVRP
jgi:hypothetical protein